jgi:ELWxxDGT repeat protein
MDLWVYRPGNGSNTRLFHRLRYVSYYTIINDRIILQIYDTYHRLFTTDTSAVTLKPLLQGAKYYSMFQSTGPMFRYGAYLYFSGTDSLKGTQLWRTDGTNSGTSLVKLINTDNNAFPDNFVILKNRLLFTAKDDVNGYEIWSTDGTTAGTKRISNLNSSVSGNSPLLLNVYKDRLYFSMDNGISGRELWSTDTAVNSSLFIKDINPGTANSDIPSMVIMNGRMFFPAIEKLNCFLYSSNGTEAGTQAIPLTDNRPYDALCNLNLNLVHNDSILYLSVYTLDMGFCIGRCRLFYSSGLETNVSENTVHLYPNPASGKVNFSRPVSGYVYARDGKLIAELNEQVSLDISALSAGLYCFVETKGSAYAFIVTD